MDEFQIDEGELQNTLTEIRSNEPADTGGTSSDETGPSPSSGASEDGAASPSGVFKPATGAEKAALGPNPTQQQLDAWRAMPKSWKKEMEKDWTVAPDNIKRYVHERETQALNGITQYKQVADRWNSTIQPYQQWFQHYKIDPHEAFNRLATAHIVLKYGRPEDRAQFAQQLINDYGLQSYVQGQGQQGQQQGPNPLEERVYALQNELERIQNDQIARQVEEKRSQVVAFFNDPKNEFAADLKADILQILEQGAATTLEEAYEKAKWLNPSVRERLWQKEIENATRPKRPGPPNVKPSSVPASPTDEADESLDDTLRQTLSRINSR